MTIVRIDRRFNGPPNSGNGGYFAGLLARELGDSDVVVTLRRPAPLDEDLTIERSDGGASLHHGTQLLAVAEQAAVAIDVPAPPTLEEARAAEARFKQHRHLYPGCFVCGPDRAPGDGWRIFPGRIGAKNVAASWTAAAEFADDSGHVRPEFIWAALDCPGYFAVEDAAGLALLGKIAVRIDAPVSAGEPLIIQGWGQGSDDRKHRAGTALHDARGRLLAVADQVWVSLR